LSLFPKNCSCLGTLEDYTVKSKSIALRFIYINELWCRRSTHWATPSCLCYVVLLWWCNIIFFIIWHYHMNVLQIHLVITEVLNNYSLVFKQQFKSASDSQIWWVAYLPEISFASCPCDEAAILWRVAYCYWTVIHQRFVVGCKIITSALQLMVTHCHMVTFWSSLEKRVPIHRRWKNMQANHEHDQTNDDPLADLYRCC
jgi:hypothetical protein